MVTASGVDFDGPVFNYDEDFDDIAPKKFERREERTRDSRGSDRREQTRGPRRDEDRGPRRFSDRGDRASLRGDRKDRAPRLAERAHERAGRIQSRSGKSVTVEKLAPRTRSEAARTDRSPQGKGTPRSKGPRPPRGR